jgi:GNAT superfamily N-acetyltransferase
MDNLKEVQYFPLDSSRWADLEKLFGKNGACSGCWCMWYRLSRTDFDAMRGEGTRRAFQSLAEQNVPLGILAYDGGQSVGWVAVAPRADYSALERSRSFKKLDDLPVWSITCFFVRRDYRRQGLTEGLIHAAVKYAAEHGAEWLEACPVEPSKPVVTDTSAFTGFYSTFIQAGFVEAARRQPKRPILRLKIR